MTNGPHSESPTPADARSLARTLLGRLRGRPGALLLSLAVAGGALFLLHRGALPIVPPRAALEAIPWSSPALYALAVVLVLLVRALRWLWLVAPLARIAPGQIVAVNFVFFAAVLALPLRLGELVRPALLRRPGVLSGWQVAGLVGAERVIDGLFSALMLLGCLALAPSPAGVSPAAIGLIRPLALGAAAFFGLAVLVVIFFYAFRERARAALLFVLRPISVRAAEWIADRLEKVAEGLTFLSRPRYGVPFILLSILYWAANIAAVHLFLATAGLDGATPARAGVVLGLVALGLLVPGAPGFFGTFQVSVYAALALYLPPDRIAAEGAGIVFWLYLVQVSVILALGLLALPTALRGLREAPALHSAPPSR